MNTDLAKVTEVILLSKKGTIITRFKPSTFSTLEKDGKIIIHIKK